VTCALNYIFTQKFVVVLLFCHIIIVRNDIPSIPTLWQQRWST